MSDDPEHNQDQIRVGNLIGNIGVAIGRGAKATVNIFRDQEQARTQRDRANMLAMVDKFWIKGVLEKSLYHGALIQIDWITTALPADDTGWRSVMQLPPALAPAVTQTEAASTLAEHFFSLNLLNRTLLILGAPGSGKTTLLLEIARQALARAQADETEPIPVVFNLSSWSVKQAALTEWLVDEFHDKYYVARNVSRPWVAQDHLLLLLDGLDEVPSECQQGCVDAIKAFRTEHSVPLVICCRMDEHALLPAPLLMQSTVTLQPLTSEQMMAHLNVDHQNELHALRLLLEGDPSLQEFAQTPLVLHTMMEAFRNSDPAQLQALTEAGMGRRQLFALYVQRMFERGKPSHPYTPAQTRLWLHWLAQQMAHHAQSVFIIERMQPSWLFKQRARWSYILLSRLLLSLIGGLAGGIVIGLGFAFYHDRPGEGIVRGFVEGLFSCLLGGIVTGLIDGLRIERKRRWSSILETTSYAQLAANILLLTLSVGVAVWVGFGVLLGGLQWLGYERTFWFNEGRDVGLLVGLCYGLMFGYGLRGGRQPLADDIQPIEHLNWSGAGAGIGALYGLLGALVSGFLMTMVFQKSEQVGMPPIAAIFQGWRILWVAIPYLMLLGGIFGGLRGSILPATSVPNQGLRASARNAILTGLTIGGILAVTSALIGGLLSQWDLGWVLTLGVYGLFFGLLAALWYGGIDVIKHAILRYLLFRSGHLPFRYARFLDYAAERIFLRKVGGGYIFIHRLLLDYFAEE